MSKYHLLKTRLLEDGVIAPTDLIAPVPIPFASLEMVHTPEYLAKLRSSALTSAEIRRLGIPWSQALWERSLLASGGTLLAARMAMQEGIAANLAGGTHHAFADHGEGFCVLNDVAVTIAQLRREGVIRRALVIDLDVHQGNGTAAILAGDAAAYTFSMHGERNYPVQKMRSSRDVPLLSGMEDAQYIDLLASHMPEVIEEAQPDLAFYLAGVDVAAGDRFGRLALTDQGIRARERMVIDAVRSRGVPLAIVLSGGYAPSPERTAELHALVFHVAAEYETC